MAIYKNTPPIVTNGLVLNLDSLNPQSIPLAPTINNVLSQSTYLRASSGVVSLMTASYSESAWYVTFKSGSTATLYKGLMATSSPRFVLEPTSSRVTYSFKIQAITKNVSMSIDINNSPYSGSNASNDNRIFAQDVYFPSVGFLVTTSSVTNAYAQYTVQTGSANFTGSYYYTFNNIYLNNGFVVDEDLTVKIWDIQHELSNWQTPFTPTSRSIWYDLSGNNNHATLLGNARPIPQYPTSIDKTLLFDGTGSYAVIPGNSILQPSSSITIESVFQRNSGRTIMSYSNNNGGAAKTYSFEHQGPIQGRIVTTSGGTILSGPTINSDTWYHTILTYDGSSVALYLNGTLVASSTTSGSLSYADGGNLNIGRKNSFDGEYIQGKVSIARVYNRALSRAEITQNYNAIKSRFGL
jgi:hypothetical protein